MKLFAPNNDWNMASGSSWFSLMGSVPTVAGVRISEEIAMSFAAVNCATRIISETIASLPLMTLRRVDARTEERATDHPLWRILHDLPNPEQDAMCFFDMQSAFLPQWGNSFSEKQFNTLGEITALWPIHPSRIPLRNIVRNATNPDQWHTIEAGQPGEIVYNVLNDDGTRTPVPASSMFHVPGVLSANGITGQSLIRWGANSIGVAMATEQHAGAFFRNGAVSNVAIKSAKSVDKPTADRLREQWQKVFGGVGNHYKTLLLEDGMEPVPFSISPEDSQLLAARQFSVTEIARWFRLPPHLLADLTHATFSNIEEQNLSFIVHAMLPWVTRWEKAMFRQLLSPKEQRNFDFRFDFTELLRGNSAARAAYWQFRFNTGSASSNDIRVAEHENPIGPDGDTYFVQGNNYVPLNKVQELADAQIEKLTMQPAAPQVPAPQKTLPAPDGQQAGIEEMRRIQAEIIAEIESRDTTEAERIAVRQQFLIESEEAVRDALRHSIEGRIVGLTEYECRALKQAARKPQTFLTWRDEFYAEFKGKLTDALEPFAPAADRLGFTFDASILAKDYVSDSTTAIEPLVDLPCQQLESGIETLAGEWSDRPRRLANFIIPERTQTCAN